MGEELCGALVSCISCFMMSRKDKFPLADWSLVGELPQAGADCADSSKVDISGDATCCSAASFLLIQLQLSFSFSSATISIKFIYMPNSLFALNNTHTFITVAAIFVPWRDGICVIDHLQ
jgi:hypothetical protein